MPATPAWLATLEALLARWVGDSAAAVARARQLEGTALRIDIVGVTCVRVSVAGGRIMFEQDGDAAANATISGTPPALLQLFNGGGARGPRTAAQIHGDAEVANGYRALFAAASPDLEEELSRVVGDVAGRHLSRAAGRAVSWLRKARHTAGSNIAEYLQEEGRDLVNRTELDEYLRGVDRVRESADRVAARLARLEHRLKGAG